jgi:hypothetical protein
MMKKSSGRSSVARCRFQAPYTFGAMTRRMRSQFPRSQSCWMAREVPRPERLPQDLQSGLTRSKTHRRIEIQKPRCRAGDVKG